MKTPLKLYVILKFGDDKYMQRFRGEGHLYMQTLRYFNKLEESVQLRSDHSEGLIYSKPANGGNITFEKSNIEFKIKGPVRFQDPSAEKIKVFSMYCITDDNLNPIRDKRLREFGDTSVVITDGDQFTERIIKECERRKLRLEFKPVEYVDMDSYDGEMGPFRKYSELRYQSEFRIAVWSNEDGPLEDFYIGDISDISIIQSSEDVINKMKVNPGQPTDPNYPSRSEV